MAIVYKNLRILEERKIDDEYGKKFYYYQDNWIFFANSLANILQYRSYDLQKRTLMVSQKIDRKPNAGRRTDGHTDGEGYNILHSKRNAKSCYS